MSRKFFLLIAPLILITLLAACASQGGGAAPTEMAQVVQPTATAVPPTFTPEPTVTATPEPTLTPTITFTPTPTEAPLPELGSFWQGYVDAHSKEVSVKIVEGVPSLVGKMSSGQEVTVAKYKDGKWVSETDMTPFVNPDGSFNLEEAVKYRVVGTEYDAAADGLSIPEEFVRQLYADVASVHKEAKPGNEKDTRIGVSSSKSNQIFGGMNLQIDLENLSENPARIVGAATAEGVGRVVVLDTIYKPLVILVPDNVHYNWVNIFNDATLDQALIELAKDPSQRIPGSAVSLLIPLEAKGLNPDSKATINQEMASLLEQLIRGARFVYQDEEDMVGSPRDNMSKYCQQQGAVLILVGGFYYAPKN
ncbi:MAG TPA: hypothetical protein PKW33_13385 [Anaerolineaceae bacterium]|nr:hypothetical protein [Anaerolineaceae bacterium]HPN52578.1 hypothetical protein [Anaerolineaceae bacterium]